MSGISRIDATRGSFSCNLPRIVTDGQWLLEAKKRYNLVISDYVVTSNHVHLIIHDDTAGRLFQSQFSSYSLRINSFSLAK